MDLAPVYAVTIFDGAEHSQAAGWDGATDGTEHTIDQRGTRQPLCELDQDGLLSTAQLRAVVYGALRWSVISVDAGLIVPRALSVPSLATAW